MRRNLVVAAVAAGILLACCSASQADWPDGRLVQADTTADMDGDGRPDAIHVAWFSTDGGYGFDRVVIQVNRALLADRGDALAQRFSVVDIDSADGRQEIAIGESGPSDDYATHFYRYSAGAVSKIGLLPGHPQMIDGSGAVATTCRGRVLETWWYPCRFRVAADEGDFERIPERYHEMNTPVRLKIDLPVSPTPWDSTDAGWIRAGEAAHLRRTDDEAWCEIESEHGVRGWFPLVGYSFIPTVKRHAMDVFDGLSMAD